LKPDEIKSRPASLFPFTLVFFPDSKIFSEISGGPNPLNISFEYNKRVGLGEAAGVADRRRRQRLFCFDDKALAPALQPVPFRRRV
jgi:hypothetical protein